MDTNRRNKKIKMASNDQIELMDILFFKTWRNSYINRNLIFKFVRLYKQNRKITFTTEKEIEEFGFKEYVYEITFRGEEILSNINCLVPYYSLEKIRFTSKLIKTTTINYPESLKKIQYNNENIEPTYFKSLPKSITSIKSACLLNSNVIENGSQIIPSNIKSISIAGDTFNQDFKPNLKLNEIFNLDYPNSSLTSLSLPYQWNNNNERLLNEISKFNNLTKLFLRGYKQELVKGLIPDSVTHLMISHPDNFKLLPGALSDNLNLECICFWGQGGLVSTGITITPKSLPINLKKLVLASPDLKIEANSLPPNLQTLEIHQDFEDPQNNKLTKEILSSVSNSLTSLVISSDNTIIEKDAFVNIKNLTNFYYDSNSYYEDNEKDSEDNETSCIVPNLLPTSVTDLYFGQSFYLKDENEEFKGIIPSSIKKLYLSGIKELPNDSNCLPCSLTYLDLGFMFNQSISLNLLPKSLTFIDFGYEFDTKLEKGVIGNQVKHIIFGFNFNQPLTMGVLPESLNCLELDHSFNEEIKIDQLPNLSTLKFNNDSSFNQEITLPKSLTSLQLSSSEYSHILDVTETPNLQSLIIPKSMKSNIKGSLEFIFYT